MEHATITQEYLERVEAQASMSQEVPSAMATFLVSAIRSLQWELENQRKLAAYYRDGARAGWGVEDDEDAGRAAVGVRAGSA
jgi:hypothetical protein